MAGKIKLVATDIDGTLVKWDTSVSGGVKDCIKKLQENGVKVVLVTGRMHCATKHLRDELGLNSPVVSYQGGLIKDSDGKTLYQENLDSDYAKEIINWAHKNDVHLNLYIDDKLYVEKDDDCVKRYTDGKFVPYTVCPFESLKIENVNKILAIDYGNAERVTGWISELQAKFPELYIVKSTPFFCEIGSPMAKKSLGVEFLAKHWNLSQDEILTIGDQNNDIELLKAGGVKVAMGNATPELKECANYITDSVENDGFVKAIEKFCFCKV